MKRPTLVVAAVTAGACLALGSDWLRGTRAGVATAQSAPIFAVSSGFHPLPPCRILDTRLPDGPLGGPYLFANSTRVFEVAGVCGIPETAGALAVNVTVTGGTGFGALNLHAADQPPPPTLVIAFGPGQTRANNAIVALSPPPHLAFAAANGPAAVHLIVDVNGFFEESNGRPTSTVTPTATPTATSTVAGTPTSAATPTPSPTRTFTPSSTPIVAPPTSTPTSTPSATPTPPSTPTATPTATPTSTASPTPAPDAPVVRIVSPPDGAAIAGDVVTVTGTYAGPPETGVSLGGVPVPAAGGTFTANEVALLPGPNTLVVTATAPDGRSAQATAVVTSNGRAPVTVRALPSSGPAPLTVRFAVGNRTGRTLVRAEVDRDGDGGTDYATSSPTVPFTVTYASPGVYATRVTLRDEQAALYVRDLRIVVLDPAALDATFRGLWSRLNAALSAGDTPAALGTLSAPAAAKYGPVFDALKPELPGIVASYTGFVLLEMSPSLAEYVLTRTIDGQPRAFLVTFLLGADGVWRIEAM